MKSATGRWVSGDDFYGRDQELALLGQHVRDGNHILLTGQRRMGKTSIARELGQRLENEGWHFLFVDVERAMDSADVVALLAEEMHGIQSMASRLRESMRQMMKNVEEVSASQFRLKVRAGSPQATGRGTARTCCANARITSGQH